MNTVANLQKYQSHVRGELEVAHRVIKTFTEALVKDPAQAMEWSDSSFKAAAKIAVLSHVDTWLKDSAPNIQDVRDSLHDRFMHAARYIDNRSTSQGANRMNDCCVSVLAEELKILNQLLKAVS